VGRQEPANRVSPVRIQPIIYTHDSERSVAWYGEVLGKEPSYRSDVWSTFDVGGATLAIHRVDGDLASESRVAISFVAEEPLETLIESWGSSSNIEVLRGIQEEAFGRSVLLSDPDGTVVQVNERQMG
jgi:predicted enzyme related to lactoylglutathione lyase